MGGKEKDGTRRSFEASRSKVNDLLLLLCCFLLGCHGSESPRLLVEYLLLLDEPHTTLSTILIVHTKGGFAECAEVFVHFLSIGKLLYKSVVYPTF